MYYKPKKIRFCFPECKIAEHPIFIPETLDSLNLPIKHGLQDTNLGPQLSELTCSSCGSSNFNCPGHFGSVDLNTMLINPLLFTYLFIVLTTSCNRCNKFKLSEHEREFCKNLSSEDLLNEIKQYSREKCPFCRQRRTIKKLNLKIIIDEKYEQPSKIYNEINLLVQNDKEMVEMLKFDFRSLFLHRIYVMPNRFRPLNIFEDQIFESSHNIHLSRIVKVNNLLRKEIENCLANQKNDEIDITEKKETQKYVKENFSYFDIQTSFFSENNGVNDKIDTNLNVILDTLPKKTLTKLNGIIATLQSTVQHYFDSSDFPAKIKPPGMKQVLEKKEGLFRQNMMGKRVNYTARTVISPDPYIATDEIGIPVKIAKKLTFPERITPFNRKRLEQAVINGSKYPGAEFVVERGVKRFLKFVKNRKIIARTLLKNDAVVYRHMSQDDYVLVNRQPTLHKPSLMSHRVKILDDKTIRLHYVNCSSYNADFDGDEMNIHLCQNYNAMAEHKISATHENFVLNGKPLRGLVQDYVVSMFQITLKNTLFTRQEVLSLLISSRKSGFRVRRPAILRPKEMFTGKQLVQFLLRIFGSVNYQSKNKIPPAYWQLNSEILDIGREKNEEIVNFNSKESFVNIQSGIFLHGVLDKSQIGPVTNSLIHHYGRTINYEITNDLLTSLCLMVSQYLIGWGVGLGLSDLILTNEANMKRSNILKDGVEKGNNLTKDVLGVELTKKSSPWFSDISQKINSDDKVHVDTIILDPNQRVNLNNTVKKEMHQTTSAISDLLIKNVTVPFPNNNMVNIILSGAKGSIVNFSQISGLLGQQSLEGGRVPTLSNGRALCTFTDLGVVSNGFIIHRFITGLTPSSFFFHCQGGREGLIDTAVKTSNAGYLQRCIVTMLENVKVEYDGSARDNGVVQFIYGEDGKNPNYSNDPTVSRNTIHPGESVGVLAAQAVGEPSTQMTLNTFHLAGCATNVTLGMPRLKEILMIGGHGATNLLSGTINVIREGGDEKKVNTIKTLFEGFIRLPLSDVLFYHRVIQSDLMEIIFVFNRNITENIKDGFKRVFFKELNKAVNTKEIIYEIKPDMVEPTEELENHKTTDSESDQEELRDFETLDDLEDEEKKRAHFNSDMHCLDSQIDDQYLHAQIRKESFEEKNTLKITINMCVSVDHVIEKMLNTFFFVNSGIENVEFNGETVFIGGIDYFRLFDPIIERSLIPIDTLPKLNHENSFAIPKKASLSELIDFYSTYSTDIQSTLEVFGIEAARSNIISEIRAVFSAYGIAIDIRHLMLIADKLTHTGIYCAFNRHKMDGSLLSKMAFENTFGFLKKSFMFQQEDKLEEPSSRLVMGLPVKNGTGFFDIICEETGAIL